MTYDNVLATIHREHIAKAAAALPAAASATDAPHRMAITLPRPDGRRILLTFRRFRHKPGETTRWFWSVVSAEVILE